MFATTPHWDSRVRFIVSHPRSGRTWLRLIVANVLNQTHSLGYEHITLANMMEVCPYSHEVNRLMVDHSYPTVAVSHEQYHSGYDGYQLAMILRHPIDTLVSFYYFLKYRQGEYAGNLIRFLSTRVYSLAGWYNSWGEALAKSGEEILVISYEEMVSGIADVSRRVLEHFRIACDAEALSQAIDASSFQAISQMESHNPPSGRVAREGRAGQHRDVLTLQQTAHLYTELKNGLSHEAQHLLRRYF